MLVNYNKEIIACINIGKWYENIACDDAGKWWELITCIDV
jgi:hypothetical protein